MATASPTATTAAWSRNLRIHEPLDVLDTTNKWTEAVVIGMTAHKVHIHYRGWPVKMNEWLAFESPRLAPAYTQVPNWRATLHKADRVQLSTDVNGLKEPVWRDGMVRQVRRGSTNAPAKVQVQLDGDRETRWVDAQDDALSAPGIHRVSRATTKQQDNDDDGDDENENDESDDSGDRVPETIVLSDDDDDESGSSSLRSSSNSEQEKTADRQTRGGGGMVTRAKKAPLIRPAITSKGAAKSTPALLPAPARRRDDHTKLPAVRKRKQSDPDGDDDFATWREQLSPGALLEIADQKDPQWYEGRVCDVRGKREICVRFRGWPWRYNEWLPRSSARLAPPAIHLGRWREFKLDQKVQIGFRANAMADAPSHWVQGSVHAISQSVTTRQVRRVEVKYTNADGHVDREWRDAHDDFLAPMGVPTYPLPKPNKRDALRGGGGPAANGGRAGGDEDEVDFSLEMDLDDAQETASVNQTLSDLLGSVTSDDIAMVIASQPPTEPLALSRTASSAVAIPTRRSQTTLTKQQPLQQAADALQASLKGVDAVKASLNAAADSWRASLRAALDAVESSLQDEADETEAEKADDGKREDSSTEAARSPKRARRKSADATTPTKAGSSGSDGSNPPSSAASLPDASPTAPHSRNAQPAEI
jgi:hypothetical protein